MTCDEVRENAAELVLGTLDGVRRAAVVAHLADCAACRDEVAALARVADALWLAAPEAEPPAGFESKVLRAVRPRRRGLASVPVRWLAAAAVLVLLAVGGVVATRTHPSASRVVAGAMVDRGHAVVGHAVVSAGTPAYVYVSLDDWGESGDYLVEVVRRDGSHVVVAPMHITAGHGAAGGPLPVALGDVRAVWVTDATHHEWCSFRI